METKTLHQIMDLQTVNHQNGDHQAINQVKIHQNGVHRMAEVVVVVVNLIHQNGVLHMAAVVVVVNLILQNGVLHMAEVVVAVVNLIHRNGAHQQVVVVAVVVITICHIGNHPTTKTNHHLIGKVLRNHQVAILIGKLQKLPSHHLTNVATELCRCIKRVSIFLIYKSESILLSDMINLD